MNEVSDLNDLNTWLRPALQFFGFLLAAIFIALVCLVAELRRHRHHRHHHHSRHSGSAKRGEMDYRCPASIRERRRYSGGNFIYKPHRHF